MNALVAQPLTNADLYRASSDAAGLCKDIVVSTAKTIGDRKFVQVEGWQAIAIAHGCAASAREVERVNGGVRAIGEVRRMSDGALIAQAEGFVGEDEPTWYGGTEKKWKWGEKRGEKVWFDVERPKRPDYAIRAMAQTRAISRACRSAFAHVVVMMNAGLSTTPAEEVPAGGFDDDIHVEARDVTPKTNGQNAREQFQATAMRLMDSISDVTTEADIKQWWPDNQRDLDTLPDDLFGQVKSHYEDHWTSIAKAAKAKSATRGAPSSEFKADELEGAFND